MRNVIRHIVMAAVAVFMLMGVEECRAQKYPERRITRQGNKAYDKGDYSAAEVNYRKALAENKTLWEADFNLGNAAYKQERYDEAAKTWGRVAQDSLRSDAEKAEAFYNIGNALFSERKWQEAIDSYKQSLRLVPDNTECKFNLAYAQKMLQEQQNQEQQQQNDQNQENQDQNQNQNQDQNNDQNQDQKDKGDDSRDQQNKDQEPEGDNKDDKQNDQKQPPKEQPQGGQQPQQQPRMSQQQAEQMLQAIQGEEDKTRDKLDKQKAVAVGRSGKNW